MNLANDDELKNSKVNRNKKEYQDLIQLLEQFLDFELWGFIKSYTYITAELPIVVIYDSKWCRVRFSVGGGDRYGGRELSISYGRLHALNDESVMIWDGEECRCWHRVNDALFFLDGLSPQEAVDQSRLRNQWPSVAEQFRHSELGVKLMKNHPFEWNVRLQATIWTHYGQRLFELYDLRQPDLWEQYVHFIKEYYRIKGLKPLSGNLGWDKIC